MHPESDSNPVVGMNPWRRASGVVAFALVGALAGCDKTPETPPTAPSASQTTQPVAAPTPKPTSITVLVTGSANGQLLPTSTEGEKPTAGAAELLGWWEAKEKHCPGQIKGGVSPCKDSSTLALSIGDNWNGPALSSFFYGETTAAVMGAMGFAASALGNHELDFGRDQFVKNQHTGGFQYLAANLAVKDATLARGLTLPGFKLFERQGLKVGIVGLTSPKTVSTAMAGRTEGLEVLPDEQALTTAIAEAQKAGADTVILLADECPSTLRPVVGKHPEWKVSLVAGGRCAQPPGPQEGGTAYVSLGRGLGNYLRAVYTFDASKPKGQQVSAPDTSLVDVTSGAGAPAPNADVAKLISDFKARLDKALGEEIGFTQKGLAKDSKQLGAWVANAIHQQLPNTDGVVLNRKGFREGLAAGPVTKGSVYTVLPFENSLMLVKVKGEDLAAQLANPEAVTSGFTPAGKGRFKDAQGKPLDPKKQYSVATIEYLYFGGDGFNFEKLDAEPAETGMSWQTPVIDWTKQQATSASKPLETLVK